jgi:hypothetical protein
LMSGLLYMCVLYVIHEFVCVCCRGFVLCMNVYCVLYDVFKCLCVNIMSEHSSVGRAIDCSGISVLFTTVRASEINWSPVRFRLLGCTF